MRGKRRGLESCCSHDCSKRVSLESRKGTRMAPLEASAETTEESASRDMLMRFASSRRAATFDAPACVHKTERASGGLPLALGVLG